MSGFVGTREISKNGKHVDFEGIGMTAASEEFRESGVGELRATERFSLF